MVITRRLNKFTKLAQQELSFLQKLTFPQEVIYQIVKDQIAHLERCVLAKP